MLSLIVQFLFVGVACGLLLLWVGQWLSRQIGMLRGRARRLGQHHGLHCVEPVSVVYDARRDE